MGTSHPRRRPTLRARVGAVLGGVVALAVVAALLAGSGVASARPTPGAPAARTARTVSLTLMTAVVLVGRPGHVSNARGTCTGTFSGTAVAQYISIGSTQGSATFTVYPKSGGSLSGRAVTHGRILGPTAYFSGTATITGGTGPWRGAHGSGLTYSGTLDRQNYHSTSTTHGNIQL